MKQKHSYSNNVLHIWPLETWKFNPKEITCLPPSSVWITLEIRMLDNVFPQKGHNWEGFSEVSSEKKYGRTCGTRYLLDWQIQLGIDSFIDIQVLSHIFFKKLTTSILNCKWKIADNQCSFSSSSNVPMPTWSSAF